MAVSERDIQMHIWNMRSKWVELIEPLNLPDISYKLEEETDIYHLEPNQALIGSILDSIKTMDNYVRAIDLIGCEVALKKEEDSTIRADLLGCSGGSAGISIIEIKKSAQTERQAFTELLGYGNHFQALFPGMSKDDLVYILISPMQERIVRESAMMSMLLEEKPIYCLIPSWTNDDVKTLKLTPWIPDRGDLVNLSEAMFNPSNIEIFKLTWGGIEGWNCENAGENPDEFMIETMNTVSQYAAQLMESKRINGFVFSSQPWSEMPLLPNSLIVAGINPFKVSRDLYLIRHGADILKLAEYGGDEVKLTDILPELKNSYSASTDPDYLDALSVGWGNTITGIAFDTYHTMTRNSIGKTFERSYGGMTWKQYQDKALEDTYAHNYKIRPTGLLRKLFDAYEAIDYEFLQRFGHDGHPEHFHGDVPNYSIENWYKQYYFREFLDRLFDPLRHLRDWAGLDDTEEEEETS